MLYPQFKIIIALGGLKHCGKSLVAEILNEVCEDTFTKLSFANPLKEMLESIHKTCPELFKLKDKDIKSIWTSKKTKRARIVLQGLGTDVIRNHIDYDYWINLFIKKLEEVNSDIIIDDVRFPNELECLKEIPGVKVFSIRVIREKQLKETKKDIHKSENALLDSHFDYIIKSAEGKKALKEETIKVLEQILDSLDENEDDFNLKPVSSSNILSVGYKNEKLYVEFSNSGLYEYTNVPQEIFESFIAASSVGKFFYANIKKGPYPYKKIR